MEDLYLIFINEMGKNWKGDYVYEFIFSNTLEGVDGPDWDEYPASGLPQPPDIDFIKKVGTLESDIKLELIQNSDTFAVWDAVDGIVAIAWEDISDYDEYPDARMGFHYGEKITDIEDRLYGIKDLTLNYTVDRNGKFKESD